MISKRMEFENQSIYMPENLYGEYVDEMLLHLSMKPSTLVGDTATKFQDIIHQHCERVWLSREFTLPSFGEGGVWLNTARSLEFEGDLKSRVYAMDFFTYCCINCIHILPFLKEVEAEHAQNPAFAIIGVHSPKFPNERHLERVKDAVIRNGIRHPVLNDPESKLWMLYEITCWPTVFVVGSDLSKLTMLYIAVAGSHQIWALDLDSDTSNDEFCVPFAGSGKEENKPNRYRMKAGFAQPSGIAYSEHSPDFIYVADSESSTIKSIDLKDNGAVQVLVGGSRDPMDLFQFGDIDGKYIDVKLQHPMSVCVLGSNILAVADTYNHKIKIVDTDKKTCTTLNTSLQLCEPNSICVIEDYHSNNLGELMILVADTNSHQIVSVPLYESSVKEVISEPIDLVIESHALAIPDDIPRTEFPLAYDGKIFCHFQWNLDSNFKLNPSGSCCDVESEGDGNVSFQFLSPEGAFGSYQPCLKVVSKSKHLLNNGTENHKFKIAVNCHIATCNEDDNLCSCSRAVFKILINFSELGPKCVKLFLTAKF